tara:strand:- start:1289 stop:1558 length:270 start_codon:yes stop_codon:yes gene_type:complete
LLPATTNGHVAGDKEEVFDRNVDYGSSMRIVGDEFRGKGRITGHEEVVKCERTRGNRLFSDWEEQKRKTNDGEWRDENNGMFNNNALLF